MSMTPAEVIEHELTMARRRVAAYRALNSVSQEARFDSLARIRWWKLILTRLR